MSHAYALFTARYAPLTGGVESFTQNLAHELAARGDRAVVVTSRLDGSPACERQGDGVEVVRLPAWSLMGGRLPVSRRSHAYRTLWRRLGAYGLDRVLVNTRFYRHSLEGLRFAQQARLPAVVLDHGTAYLTLGGGLADRALRAYERGITRRGLRYGARYAGISQASAAWLAEFGIHTREVVPNALDGPAFRAMRSGRDFRSELGVRADQTLVAFAGRLVGEKGADRLVEAARLLGPSFVCAMAGEGPLRADIERDIPANVRLLGLLSHDDLSALFAASDLFCLPSRSEGFCLAFMEAAAWGVQPVMPHVGVVDEVLGEPAAFGSYLPDLEPATIAACLQGCVATGRAGRSEELARRIDDGWSWDRTVEALDRCFS